MKKFLAFLLLLVAFTAEAQTFTVQNLDILGTFSSGSVVPLTSLALQTANSVVGNGTSSSLAPTALSMPSCNTTTSALNWATGTGFTCGGSGFAALAGATFTGATGLSYNGPTFTLNDTSAANDALVAFNSSGSIVWQLGKATGGSAGLFALARFNSGAYVDEPIAVSNSTGVVTMVDGITSTPISGSTGSFTTIAASGLISPTSSIGVKGTTTNDTPSSGSVGEVIACTTSSVGMTNNSPANLCSMSLTAGDWDVYASVYFIPASGTVATQYVAGINTTSATLPGITSTTNMQVTFPATAQEGFVLPAVVEKFAGSATVYCVAQSAFTVSTMAGECAMFARRRR